MTQDISHVGRVPVWTLADRLRKAREMTGLGQAEWAAEVGISRRSVTNYESGTSVPRRPVLLAWAMRSGVRLDWLTDADGPEGTPAPNGANRRYADIHDLRRRIAPGLSKVA